VRSPPAGISSFGKIRQMSDLVIPQVAKAATSGPAACDHEGGLDWIAVKLSSEEVQPD
jgi:hypothetical protein